MLSPQLLRIPRDGLRDELASMMDRLGHEMITISPWLVTIKDGRKYVTDCANRRPRTHQGPDHPALDTTRLSRANAARGIYVTPRSFTPTPSITLHAGRLTLWTAPFSIKSMQRSRRGVLLPLAYKAMCQQAGTNERPIFVA